MTTSALLLLTGGSLLQAQSPSVIPASTPALSTKPSPVPAMPSVTGFLWNH